jgi:hypothetical protein
MPMDAWDGDTKKMSTQSFLRVFHCDIKVMTSSTDKEKVFKMYLVPGSEVENWFAALPATMTELLKSRIMMEELGIKIKQGDHDVWAHHAWINKILCLATKVGIVKTTTYIEQVHQELPAPLHTKIKQDIC